MKETQGCLVNNLLNLAADFQKPALEAQKSHEASGYLEGEVDFGALDGGFVGFGVEDLGPEKLGPPP